MKYIAKIKLHKLEYRTYKNFDICNISATIGK